jgi:molecular chaperone DnaK
MGTDNETEFRRTGRRMKPEELSAEVLKSLKGDVRQRTGEEVRAAVITVPAGFELPQCEATVRAAHLAGLAESPLVQEPVAAALTYGFQSESDKAFWLVYDFGGGTFDAAVMQVRDGEISVVNHEGDNHLGGKLIDWAIVEQLLIPALLEQHKLKDFRRGNPNWIRPIAKLKLKAEEAKIRISRDATAPITTDFLCVDERGEPIGFDYELRREDVEALAEPFVLRSISICRKALADRRLKPEDVQKLILVGGPTMMPAIRERLLDPKHGLGIPLEFSIDPLTVVARGAAIFAGSHRLDAAIPAVIPAGHYGIQLEYKPVGSDPEPEVGGRVIAPEQTNLQEFTIELVNRAARPAWSSGRIGLSATGSFIASLFAQKGVTNVFMIELRDGAGVQHETLPDRLSYTLGTSITSPPLIHSLGVAMANNETEWIITKGTALPAKKHVPLRTTVTVRQGNAGHAVRIPIIEGQHARADRNQQIGELRIYGSSIRRDLPVGTEVEVTIDIDASRIVRASAYVPLLDEEFESVIDYQEYGRKAKDVQELSREAETQRKRLEEWRVRAAAATEPIADAVLRRIDSERMLYDIESSLAAANDRDAADKCHNRLLALAAAVDEIEDALQWPTNVKKALDELEVERRILVNPDHDVRPEERAAFAALERELQQAIAARDADHLRRMTEDLDSLGSRIVWRNPAWWVAAFHDMEEKAGGMNEVQQAEGYLTLGRRAMNNNDLESLKSSVRQLAALLPAGDPQRGLVGSDVTR